MLKIGMFVGEDGNWTFLREIYDDLVTRYPVEVFKKREYDVPLFHGRLNRWAHSDGIRAVLRRNDVSYFEWASELLAPASQLPKRHKIVTRLHSYEIYAWAPKVNWDHVDGVILVSQAMKRKFEALYPAQAHKATVVYYGKPLDKFTPVQREFNFNLGMLCGIHPIKRIYEVILAVHELRAQGIGICTLAGAHLRAPGSASFAVHRLVEMLKLEDAVTFHGHVGPAQWLRIDVFISTVTGRAAECAAGGDGNRLLLPVTQLGGADEMVRKRSIHGQRNIARRSCATRDKLWRGTARRVCGPSSKVRHSQHLRKHRAVLEGWRRAVGRWRPPCGSDVAVSGYLMQADSVDMSKCPARNTCSRWCAGRRRGHKVRLLSIQQGQIQWSDDLLHWHAARFGFSQSPLLARSVLRGLEPLALAVLPFLRQSPLC